MNNSESEKQELKACIDLFEKNRSDIQGLITNGHQTLPAARFLLLKIIDPGIAKSHLSSIQSEITSAHQSRTSGIKNSGEKALQIAFTRTGLEKLLLPEDILATFPREFLEGMSYCYQDPKNPDRTIKERSTLLGDVGTNAPENWHWGNADNPVDCILLLYAKNGELLNQLTTYAYPGPSTGLMLAYTANTYQYKDSNDIKEHFGFRDGISQPIIKGLHKSNETMDASQLLNPGEFILGHRNEYRSYSPGPFIKHYKGNKVLHSVEGKQDLKDLGKNGTFLVFRQMEQHVERFWNFMYETSRENAPSQVDRAIKLAAKMVGRWPEGQPLATDHDQPKPHPANELNKFDYSDTDKYGLGCPFGAHIRRTNPRDMVHAGRGSELSIQISNKHRMLRRGRIYGNPLDRAFNIPNMIEMGKIKQNELGYGQAEGISAEESANDKIEIKRGVHFMCLVSDISRQFEFVQSVWGNTRTFGELNNEVDPIISPGYEDPLKSAADFTTPQVNIRNKYKAVPEFTNVVGGEYFFMPGITTLNYILDL
jgi:Dyp-type peroxidase family